MTSLFRSGLGVLAIGVMCSGCTIGDLGTDVPHKPHPIAGNAKGGGADMDLLPAPPGMKTGTPK